MVPGLLQPSKKVEHQRMCHAHEEAIRSAAQSYRTAVAAGRKASVKAHARATGVKYQPLLAFLKGKKQRSKVDAEKLHLGAEELQQLVDWLVHLAECGFPLSDTRIRGLANDPIRKLGKKPAGWSSVGNDWVRHFRQRFEKQLGHYWSKPLDCTRASGLSAEHVRNWYVLLSQCIVEHDVPASRIFAMDESGVQISVLQRQMVTGGKPRNGRKKSFQHRQGSNNRELVSVIATICADGSVLPPAVIFKGSNLLAVWVEDNPLKAQYVLPLS